jgi:hypothetical protein
VNAGENFCIIRWLGLLTNVYSQFVEQPFQPFDGRENQDKEAFIQEFTEKVEQLRVSTPDAELVAEKRECLCARLRRARQSP